MPRSKAGAQVPVGLPQQDNHCDCGLFLLTYLEYFCFDPPATIHCNRLEASLRGGLLPAAMLIMPCRLATACSTSGSHGVQLWHRIDAATGCCNWLQSLQAPQPIFWHIVLGRSLQ